MNSEAIAPSDLIFLEAEKLRRQATDRGPWRHAVRDFLTGQGNRSSIHSHHL